MTRAQLQLYLDYVGAQFGRRPVAFMRHSAQLTDRAVLVDAVLGVAHTLEWSEKARDALFTTTAQRGVHPDLLARGYAPPPTACAVGMDAIARFEAVFGQPLFDEVALEVLAVPDPDPPEAYPGPLFA